MTETQQKILIVEDEPELRSLLRDDLESEGYEMFEADGGTAAFEFLKTQSVDVVVTDIRMPQGSGSDLLKKLRAIDPNKPRIVLMTAYADLEIDEALDLGAQGLLMKPWGPNALAETIKDLLTTPTERWRRAPEAHTLTRTINLKCTSFASGAQASLLKVARGGVFVALDSVTVKVDECITVAFGSDVAFKGIVRWTRNHAANGLKSGIGLELFDVSKAYLPEFETIVGSLKGPSFIPRSL